MIIDEELKAKITKDVKNTQRKKRIMTILIKWSNLITI